MSSSECSGTRARPPESTLAARPGDTVYTKNAGDRAKTS